MEDAQTIGAACLCLCLIPTIQIKNERRNILTNKQEYKKNLDNNEIPRTF